MNPYMLKPKDKVRFTSGAKRGVVYMVACGCVVIEWHGDRCDPLRLTSPMWVFLERDE